MSKKILYVEDEPFLGKIVKETLELKGFKVELLTDGAVVMDCFQRFVPDICVLDVMLPHVDGFTLGKFIREKCPQMPILFLTAKTQTADVLEGFASGGTEYVRKPFGMEELLARINNQLQLANRNQVLLAASEIKIGACVFFPKRYELQAGTEMVRLSHRESQVLTFFAIAQNQVIDRKKLLLEVWGDDSFFNSRTLDVYVRKLRDHFAYDPKIEIITLKGKGYHFLVSA